MADDDENRPLTDDLGDLQFGPAWARTSSSEAVYAEPSRRDDGPRGRRSRDSRRPASASRPMPRRAPGPGGGGHGPRHGGGPDRRRHDHHDGPRPVRFDPNLPVIVSFLPERDHLGALVKKIRHACRAYPLRDLAQMFVDRPSLLLVKFEAVRPHTPPPRPAPAPAEATEGGEGGEAAEAAAPAPPAPAPAPETMLHQCRICGYAGFDREDVVRHIAQDHLSDLYEAEEIEVEAPDVQAASVLKCGYTGEWIGPPQLHSTAQRILEVHRERFAHLPLETYKAKLETCHDAESIEAWRQASRKQVRYRLKDQPEAAPRNRREAEEHVRIEVAPRQIRSGVRAIVPAPVAETLADPILRQGFLQARGRETQYPRTLMDALRPAFRHMRMKLFKHGDQTTYVTAVPPDPLDPAQAAEPVRKILDVLRAHPGAHRKDLCLGLGLDLANAEACQEALTHLRWLIEKGHVIELFSGALILPGS